MPSSMGLLPSVALFFLSSAPLLCHAIRAELSSELNELLAHKVHDNFIEALSDSNRQTANLSNPDPTTGAWEAEDLQNRPHQGLNTCLADQIKSLSDAKNFTTISDYGAGSGAYSKYLIDQGIDSANLHCYDGNTAIVDASGGLCQGGVDLSSPQPTLPVVDVVYALEIGEHIPKDREPVFLKNLNHAASKQLFLSWAIPGQGGNGHVNCQTNDYIIGEMAKLGLAFDDNVTKTIRDKLSSPECHDCANSEHFPKTLMVFNRVSQ